MPSLLVMDLLIELGRGGRQRHRGQAISASNSKQIRGRPWAYKPIRTLLQDMEDHRRHRDEQAKQLDHVNVVAIDDEGKKKTQYFPAQTYERAVQRAEFIDSEEDKYLSRSA